MDELQEAMLNAHGSVDIGTEPGAIPEGGPVGPRVGSVAAAALTALAGMQSDHAGAPLLKAIAGRLCEDIDAAVRIPERIAATRMVLTLLEVLDGAMFASTRLPAAASGDDESSEPEAGDIDDPFKIGQLPPGVGDKAP